jgi:hypothetical protein
MEKTLSLATSQHRLAHLTLLANGEEILQEQRSKYLPGVIVCISLLAITGIVIYYEIQLKKVGERLNGN